MGNLVNYSDTAEWTGQPDEASKEAEAIPLPEVDVSRFVADDVTPGIPIDTLITGGPEIGSMQHADLEIPDPMPLEHYRHTAVSAVPLLLSDVKPYRVVVTITSVGDAVQFELSHRSDFSETQIVGTASLPLDVSVHSGRQLWMRQLTLVDQNTSFMVEPRGFGR